MKNLKLISVSIMMLISFLSFGQDSSLSEQAKQKTITGVVSDVSGPLPGVNVVVKGTQRGTQTNFDGTYAIKAKIGESLVYSFMGMQDVTRTIGSSNIINVKMQDEAKQLESVVVTCLGIKRKKDVVTSSYQAVKSSEINQSASPNVVRSLSGKVSGLQINTINSSVSGENRVVFRCSRSITCNNKALVVINGAVSSLEILQQIPSKNISSVNSMKGAQGAAIYGSDGVNGVIVVTTKTGLSKRQLKKLEEKAKKTAQQPVNIDQEEYDNFVENVFESPKTAPLSTFSIDVDNASYTNIRRFINSGQEVPKDAVRVEEMMNFFKYQYPQPKDNNPFSINTEYSDCPWNAKHQLVKIGLQGKNISTETLPASNFVFLIDVSGSMSDDNKLPLVKESLKVLVEKLRKEDKISIVVYAGAAGLVLPPTSGSDKKTILKALENLNAGGSTAGGAGIQLAYKTAEENFIKGGNNRVVLATDGDFNVGASSDGDMQTLIEEKRKSGVFLTCLGYGMGNYKDSKMEVLADKGNGNYAYIDNIQEANRFLGKEFKGSMFAIAKDVKIQIEFNPKHVQSYRLIGYENRKLRPEDFKNDAIDAGELGSNHTVTALYEIIPTGVQSDFYADASELKYTDVAPSQNKYNDELATIKFRYKRPDGDKSIEMIQVIENQPIKIENSSADFKFSSSVAWFGLKLRDSKLVSNKSSKEIEKLARLGLSNDTDGYKAEFIRLVEAVR